jgi:hypothetical protein
MRQPRHIRIALYALVAGSTLRVPLRVVQAQAAPPWPDGTAVAGETGGVFGAAAFVAALAVIAAVVKLCDLWLERRQEAVALQSRIADALLWHPSLRRLPIQATAHQRAWRASAVTIEIRGQVPTPALRKAAMALVIREAFSSGVRFCIEDGTVVDPSVFRRAA